MRLAAGFAITVSLLLLGPSAFSGPREDVTTPIPSSTPVPWRLTKECGVNCLYVLLRMHGVEITLEELRGQVAVSDEGASMAELARVASIYGVPMTPMKANPASVRSWPLPAILHTRRPDLDQHYLLLVGIGRESYRILDCTSGEYRPWSEGEFQERWSGYALIPAQSSGSAVGGTVAYLWLASGVVVLGLGVRRLLSWGRRGLASPAGEFVRSGS